MGNQQSRQRQDIGKGGAVTDQSQQASTPQGALTKLEGSLKVRYLGLGFVWAWIYASFETFAVYPDRTGIAINADASWIASAACVVTTLLIGGVLLSRIPRIPAAPLGIAAALLMTAGTLLSTWVEVFGPLAVAIAYVSGAATGIGSGLLTLLWGQALAGLDIESSELAIPASSLVMVGCALVIPYLPTFAGTLATASLPLASGVMLLLTLRDLNAVPEFSVLKAAPTMTAFAQSAPAFSGRFARIAVLLLITYCVTGCGEALQANADIPFQALGIDWPSLIGSGCGVILMAVFLFFAARPTFDSLFRLMAPLIMFFLALLPWADLWAVFVGTTFTAVSNTVLTIASMLFVVKAANRGAVNGVLGVGITQGALQLGVLVGNVAGMLAQPIADESPTGLFAIALALICVFALSWLFYPTDRMGKRRTSLGASASSGATDAITGASAVQPNSTDRESGPGTRSNGASQTEGNRAATLDATCAALALTHGLSGRETEILGYLARGRSQPYIREELVLSKNTVATHVKHIYQKLNVHSRQELLDLFDEAH